MQKKNQIHTSQQATGYETLKDFKPCFILTCMDKNLFRAFSLYDKTRATATETMANLLDKQVRGSSELCDPTWFAEALFRNY